MSPRHIEHVAVASTAAESDEGGAASGGVSRGGGGGGGGGPPPVTPPGGVTEQARRHRFSRSSSSASRLAGVANSSRSLEDQGLTLVHFSAQPEPFGHCNPETTQRIAQTVQLPLR